MTKQGFLGTIGWIKSNLMISSQASEKGYSNENFYPGASDIPDSEAEQKQPLGPTIPVMTSNTTPYGVASAYTLNSMFGNGLYAPYKAFTDNRSCSSSQAGTGNFNLIYTYPELQNKGEYSIRCMCNYESSVYCFSAVYVYVQDTSDNWHLIWQKTDVPYSYNKIYTSPTIKINHKFKAIKFEAAPYTAQNRNQVTIGYCQLTRIS